MKKITKSAADAIMEYGEVLKEIAKQHPGLLKPESGYSRVISRARLEMHEEEAGYLIGAYVRGWVNKKRFIDTYNWDYGEEFIEADVEHQTVRLIPTGDDHGLIFYFNQKPGRGAFKITHLDLDAAERRKGK